MTMLMRRLIQLALGIAAGLATWPVMEALVQLQERFPSYLAYAVVSGALFGLLFGAFLGGAEGIIASNSRRIVSGSVTGGIIGAAGGALGFLAAQGLLFVVGEYLLGNLHQVQHIAMPITRAVGWAVLGGCVGAAGGLRSVSGRKTGIGASGGFLGGLLGGAAVEYGRLFFPAFPVAHLVGLLLLGVLIGLAYAFVEKRLSFGVFRLLNGPFKSREYILNQRRIVIGSRSRCDIPLPPLSPEPKERSRTRVARGYRDVAATHCRLVARGRDLFIEPLEGLVRVNDQRLVAEETGGEGRGARKAGRPTPLKFDDVIACGAAKFLYKRD